MENSQKKAGGEPAKEREKLSPEEEQLKVPKKPSVDISENYHKHDFAHTHPSHARHKNFGMDHEPGAF
jgi:hypothetical protein